jgi:shikimate dehydrogenase
MFKAASRYSICMLQLGIVGFPLKHTLSPLLHHTIMQRLGLAGEYAILETELLANMLNQLMLWEMTGFNVTIPYKVAVIPYCDQLSETARVLQAVNTVKRFNNQWHGDNTDVTGYLASLPVKDTLNQRRCTVLGTGGAARAVVAGLIMEHADHITLVGRNAHTTQALQSLALEWVQHFRSRSRVTVMDWPSLTDLSQTDLLINTTPIGTMDTDACPIDPDLLFSLPTDAYVSDLVYRPLETRLVAESRAAGYDSTGGLGMLVHQGIQAFSWWSGLTVPIPVVDAVFNTLKVALTGSVLH